MENLQFITMNHILIVTALFAAVLALFALLFALKAMIEVRALQQSTHSVTWMPADSAKTWADDDKKIKDLNLETKDFYRESGF